MDILIKGMEMPKDDALSVIIYPDGVVEVQVGWNGDIPVYSNAFKTTAIPVPEHGDLIDRDDLVARFQHFTSHPTGYDVVSKIFEAEVVLERTT